MTLAENEIERSIRYHKKCSMIMIDIDNYKMVNDTFGHGAGDHVLVEFSKLCKGSIRRMDIFGRLGGDEFGLILPETDLTETQKLAERLRLGLEKKEIEFNGALIKVTACFGIAQLKGKIRNLESLMESADQAMYEAKQAGKNRMSGFGMK
jgi:diguanylate cyclase (GGDEF)-like protein